MCLSRADILLSAHPGATFGGIVIIQDVHMAFFALTNRSMLSIISAIQYVRILSSVSISLVQANILSGSSQILIEGDLTTPARASKPSCWDILRNHETFMSSSDFEAPSNSMELGVYSPFADSRNVDVLRPIPFTPIQDAQNKQSLGTANIRRSHSTDDYIVTQSFRLSVLLFP